MLGFIASIVTFVAAATEAGKIGNTTRINRDNARYNKEIYYIDGNNKWRSTKTDEILYRDYYGGNNKLVGVETGIIYKDHNTENTINFICKQNEILENKGVPIYWKKCRKYWNGKEYSTIHLYEKTTGRPFKVLTQFAKKGYGLDYNYFVIEYLDENNGMKPVNEYANVPSKWYLNYKMGC